MFYQHLPEPTFKPVPPLAEFRNDAMPDLWYCEYLGKYYTVNMDGRSMKPSGMKKGFVAISKELEEIRALQRRLAKFENRYTALTDSLREVAKHI